MKKIVPFLVVALLTACVAQRPATQVEPPIGSAHYLLISKEQMRLSVVDSMGVVVARFPIACGENYGDKQREGDRKTPEGLFWVEEILPTGAWEYDYGDGQGRQRGAYGPYFIRLHTPPHTGIGIHGTRLDHSIGKRASAGCVRMHNSDLLRLVPAVYVGMPVFVTPSKEDDIQNLEFKIQN